MRMVWPISTMPRSRRRRQASQSASATFALEILLEAVAQPLHGVEVLQPDRHTAHQRRGVAVAGQALVRGAPCSAASSG